MEWISVKDRLPENEVLAIGYQNEMIIGYVSGDVNLAQFGRMGTGFICENDYETLTNVTHWMPLPEVPNT